MCTCRCRPSEDGAAPRRRGGFLRLLVNVVILYVVLVFGGGTLINTGHPVAAEVGRIMHLVTFVEPTLAWADGNEYRPVSAGLRTLSHGYPL